MKAVNALISLVTNAIQITVNDVRLVTNESQGNNTNLVTLSDPQDSE